jgi:aldehyde:ferredoxin oxidoreductase
MESYRIHVERAYNARDGLTRADDTPPDKFFEDPIESRIRVLDRKIFEKLKDDYYTIRKWDFRTGHPTAAKLEELGLKYIADDLRNRKVID